MYIYILLLLYLIVLTLILNVDDNRIHKNKKENLYFIILAFIPIIIISGLRSPEIGVDTQQFVNAFNKIKYMSISDFSSLRYEYGFSFLCWALSKISSEPQILIFTTSLIINYSVAEFIYKNSKNVYLSTILYLICNFFFSNMNIMRQALAISIVLLGYEKLKNAQYLKFIGFVIIASQFHSSAILSLLYIPLKKFKFTKKSSIIVLFATVLAFLLGRELFEILARFSTRLYDYMDSNFTVENYFGSLLDFLVYFISFLFGIFILSNQKKSIETADMKEVSDIIGNMGFAVIFSVMIMRVILFNRFTPYFTIFMIIWLPNCLKLIKNGKDRLMLSVLVVFAFCLYWVIIMIYRPEWYGVIPYKFCF